MKVIVTGTTGMVGEGVLYECLQDPGVTEVLSIARKPSGHSHPKMKEILHQDFFNFSAIEKELGGYDACLFCLGVSSIGMKEPEYYKFTYTLTMHVASTLSRVNPGMTFSYISGAGTDSSEKGKIMWARVKGKTENDLRSLGFKRVFAFRPGFIRPTKGLKHELSFYKYVNWLFPIGRFLYPAGFCTLKQLGIAMIKTARDGYGKDVIGVKDIVAIADGRA